MFDNLRNKLKESVDKLSGGDGNEEEPQEGNDSADEDSGFSLTKRVLDKEEVDEVVWDLEVGLIENDVSVETAERIKEELEEELVGSEVGRMEGDEAIRDAFRSAVRDILDQEPADLVEEIKAGDKPFTVLFVGFNGSGKTTTIARVAKLLQEEGLTCVLAAGDTWRAAAIDQLEEHGEALDVRVIKHDYQADSAAVIYDAVEYAEKNDIDAVLADTAGRSHTDTNLMDELAKIGRVIEPDRKILVIDSLTGNDAVDQARSFEEEIGVDGIVLTKMDINEKGGAALSVAHSIEKPIYYLGVGQGYEDLKTFNPDEISEALLT